MFKFSFKFIKAFHTHGYDFNVTLARNFCCLFLVYKLLSRDFGFYGTLPDEFFEFPPIFIYGLTFETLWTGFTFLTEIFTFHWIHWIIPRPNVEFLRFIQGFTILSLTIFSFFGNYLGKIWGLLSLSGILYLWGHLFLSKHEVDSVAIYFGIMFVLVFMPLQQKTIFSLNDQRKSEPNLTAGIYQSSFITIFILYYFASGFNKLTDIPILEFFDNRLNVAIQVNYVREVAGLLSVPDLIYEFSKLEFKIIDHIGPFLVYASHLATPYIMINRNLILKFAIFYWVFHFIVFGLSISFTGYIFVWFLIIPYKRQRIAK